MKAGKDGLYFVYRQELVVDGEELVRSISLSLHSKKDPSALRTKQLGGYVAAMDENSGILAFALGQWRIAMVVDKLTKAFGIYHWDTFDNETLLVDEADTVEEAMEKVNEKYKDRIGPQGADQVDIVSKEEGAVVASVKVQ